MELGVSAVSRISISSVRAPLLSLQARCLFWLQTAAFGTQGSRLDANEAWPRSQSGFPDCEAAPKANANGQIDRRRALTGPTANANRIAMPLAKPTDARLTQASC
uniref:Uncharacterized protein n=1 Tax=Knipowitschia caucasica TaxID=637954 RepID=A0AAV2KHA1_KNICA